MVKQKRPQKSTTAATETSANANSAIPAKGKTLFIPSKELSGIIGVEPTTRNDALKCLWRYIKSHKLQDDSDGRTINADTKLKTVLKQNAISMFKLTGVLAQHLVKR